ncbi:hypothetical protein GCM10010170_082920 [Dactylosporangium salmoneum]|uniref:Uncharacterized protein n=1 Tax=Dactylosporangium salmoneum TaxID=53361 RepID=A0ABP5UEF0_9ACTN
MYRGSLAPVPQVQHDVLRQRQRAVGVTGRPHQGEYLLDLVRGKVISAANRRRRDHATRLGAEPARGLTRPSDPYRL